MAEKYLTTATTINPHHAESLTLLGRVELQRQNYAAARSALQRALADDADNWIVRTMLADTYLKEHEYEKAREEAEIALETGKDEALAAHLVLGQALVGLGSGLDAIQSLNTFLQSAPHNPMSEAVRALIEEIQKRNSDQGSGRELETDPRAISTIDALSALASPAPSSIAVWQPPGIDQVRPPLVEHVACPVDRILSASGERIRQLVDDVSRFAAVEQLVHKNLDPFGNPLRTEERKFNYVAAISESQPGFLEVSEYRADKMSLAGYPDHIASTGFAALALVFHPDMRENFQMTCEGLGQWQRKAAWVIRFRQRDDRPSRIHSYKVGSQMYAVKLKGRAWVTADNFQIVRIESELVSPMPQIQLLSEHQIVEYGPVFFQKKRTQLWLPKSAEIYFHFRKHRYYRRHSFDHYMLFAVDTNDKPQAPSTPESPPS
jgi:tetratricopeptide (TPR) repeat protein